MTSKEKAIAAIQTLEDDASIDEMIDSLSLLRKVEIGLAQAAAGDVVDHDELFDELEREDEA